MARSVPTWVGKTHDTAIPPRVKLRVWEEAKGRCASCKREILAGEKRDYDHIIALGNSGPNSEDNIQLLCFLCHRTKTKTDVKIKAYNYRRKLANAGIKKRKYRPMDGSRDSAWKITFSRGAVRR